MNKVFKSLSSACRLFLYTAILECAALEASENTVRRTLKEFETSN